MKEKFLKELNERIKEYKFFYDDVWEHSEEAVVWNALIEELISLKEFVENE